LLTISAIGRDISKKLGPKISIIEIFIIAIVISYLFSYYYFQESLFENFIIPSGIIWIVFVASVLLLGIGIGARFILNLMSTFINEKDQTPFFRNIEIYEVFSGIWMNMSILIIFFTYALMEISKPVARISTLYEQGLVYGLSLILGFLFFFLHKQIHFFVQRITLIAMLLICFCLGLFIFESRIEFLSFLPVTTSFIVFNISFFAIFLYKKKFSPKELEITDDEIISYPNQFQTQNSQTSKPEISLNFGNTSIFTRTNDQHVKLPHPEVLKSNSNNTKHNINFFAEYKIPVPQNVNNKPIDKFDDPRQNFSLNDLKGN
jgi:hypothetical protein